MTSYDGGPAKDTYLPRDGRDTITYAGTPQPVSVTLDGLANDGITAEGENVPSDIEVVEGGALNDMLTGNPQANELRGADGADQLFGESGPDTLTGVRLVPPGAADTIRLPPGYPARCRGQDRPARQGQSTASSRGGIPSGRLLASARHQHRSRTSHPSTTTGSGGLMATRAASRARSRRFPTFPRRSWRSRKRRWP